LAALLPSLAPLVEENLKRCAIRRVIVSMNRLAADIAELNGAALNIGRATAGATRDLEHAGQELMSAAGSKPGMPAIK
jgi:hypothetical protein